MRTRDLVCPYCLASASALRFDRKGRPYFSCSGCGARAFLTALRSAVRSLALVQPMLAARVEEIELNQDARARAHALEGQVAVALRAQMRSRADATATTALDAPARAAER
jgi:transposase-like protein